MFRRPVFSRLYLVTLEFHARIQAVVALGYAYSITPWLQLALWTR